MNLPNLITIIRIFLMPLYLYFFYSDMENGFIYAGIIFIIAGISDVLDGYIARNFDMKTKLGALLDPLADKIVVFTILISFTHKGIIPSWILLAMGLKEVIMILGGAFLYLFGERQVVPSNIYGKVATVLFYVSIVTFVIGLPENISRNLLSLTVVLNIIAFLNYLIIFIKMRKEENLSH